MSTLQLDRPALTGLRHIALLQGLDDTVLAEVAAACRCQLVRPRQIVLTRADADRDCYLVLSGRLRVVAFSSSGREVSFRDAHAGETIGELAALDGEPRSASVEALQESVLARLSPADLVALMRRHWPIAERMLLHLARTARMLTDRVYELSTLNVQQRLCAELLRLALAAGGARSDRVELHDLPSHSQLSTRIATSREEVTRAFAALLRSGLVQQVKGERTLVIDDLRQLARRIEVLDAPA
jgi:CRP-like cAMP-binding protein